MTPPNPTSLSMIFFPCIPAGVKCCLQPWGAESHLPLINEFLKTGQTEQPWHEVIGCWTFDCVSLPLAGDEGQDEELGFTTRRRDRRSHHHWPASTERGTEKPTVKVCFPCTACFTRPGSREKGLFVGSEAQRAAKVQHLKEKRR